MIVDRNKPVVFLDLCGVIADTWLIHNHGIRPYLKPGTEFTTQYFRGDRSVRAVKDLLVSMFLQYDVQLIIVSSWVKSHLFPDDLDIKALREYLEYDEILGSLSTGGSQWRGECVKEFVQSNDITKWVVIDDAREQMYQDTVFFDDAHFVHPHGRYGFWLKEAEHLDGILKGFTQPPED